MELSTAQRRLVFAVIVLVLAGLGVYLLDSAESGSSQASTGPTASPSHHRARREHAAGQPPADRV